MSKGLIDMVLIMVFIIVISIFVLISYHILDLVGTGFSDLGFSTTGIDSSKTAVQVWDGGFVFFIVFLGIVNIASALVLRTHPIFFVVSLLILVTIGVLAPTFSNVYDSLATTLGSTNTTFSSMGFVMRNMSIFFLVIGSLTAIIMYSKSREAGF